MKLTPKLLSFLLGSSLLAAITTANAQSTWTGETDNNWGVAGNWNPSGLPDTTALFTSASDNGYSIVLGDDNRTIPGITFDSTTGATPYTINLYDTDLDTRRILRVADLTVEAGNHVFTGDKPSNVVGDFRPENNAVFDIASGASLDLNVRLRHLATTHAYSKTGEGTLILSANNGGSNAWQFSAGDGFQVQQGVLRFAAGGSSGNTANKFIVSSGAVIEMAGVVLNVNTTGDWSLSGTGIGGNGALRATGGTNSIGGTGSVTLAANPAIGADAGSTLTISTLVQGSGNLTKVGDGTLVLSNTNTFTGTAAVSAGILSLTNADALQSGTLDTTASITGDDDNGLLTDQTTLKLGGLTGGDDLATVFTTNGGFDADTVTTIALTTPLGVSPNYAGAITGSRALTQAGPGAQTLSGENTYTGGTTVTGGALSLLNTLTLPATGTHSFAAGTTLGLGVSGANAFTTDDLDNAFAGNMTGDLAGITLDAATNIGIDTTLGNFTYTADNASTRGLSKIGPNTLFLTGESTYTGPTTIFAGTLQVQGSIATSSGILNHAALVFNSASDQSFENPITGSGTLAKQGAGVLSLSGENTYTGATSVTGGVLRIDDADALGGANLLINSGGILGLGSGNFSRNIGTGNNQVRWGGTSGAGFAAYGENRTVSLGGGAINWTAANFIGGGRTLFLSHETADATLIWQKAISLAGSNRTVNVADGSADIDGVINTVFSGGSNGNSNFIKAGAGTLAITGQFTHSGNTVINGGTLMIGNGGETGGLSSNAFHTSISVADGATLAVNRSNDLAQGDEAFNGTISGAGGFAQVGEGTTTITVNNTYTGPTTVSAGILQIGNGGTTGTLGNNSDTFIAEEAELRIERLLDQPNSIFGYDYFGQLSGSGTVNIPEDRRLNFRTVIATPVNQTQSGNLSFVVDGILGINTSSGVTEVQLGELSGSGNIQRAGTAPTEAPDTVIQIGGKNTDSTFSGNINNVAEFALEKTGSGTVTLEGSYSHGRATTVTAGTLALGEDAVISNSSAYNIAAGAVLDTTAKATYAMPAGRTFTFGIDAGTATTGTLTAQELDITDAVVALDIDGTLSAPAYVLATYTSLTGGEFATEPAVPSGYTLQYAYQGDKIALVQTTPGDSPYDDWANGAPFDGDANGDGVPNGLAFLLGADNPQENALGLLPAATQSGGALVLTFQMRNAAARGDAVLNIQHSGDLGSTGPWTTVPVPDTSGGPVNGVTFAVTPGTPLNTVTATIDAGEAVNGKLFARCSATEE